MQRLLALVYEPAHVSLGLTLAGEGRRTGRFDTILWCPYYLPDTERYRADALAAGSVYVNEASAHGSLADIWTPLSGWYSAKPSRLPVQGKTIAADRAAVEHMLAALAAHGLGPRHEDVLRAADRCERRIRFCENLMVDLGIDAVVMAEENTERDCYAWIAAAGRRGIRSVVASYGSLSATAAAAEAAYAASPAHQVDAATAEHLRAHLPHWLREGDGYRITRLPLAEALGRELTGVAPWSPWIVNAGQAHLIALESERQRRVYLEYRFPERQLIVTGHTMFDALHRTRLERSQRRAAIETTHGIPAHAPLILVALPPDQYDTRAAPEFATYDTLADAFTGLPRSATGAAVIVTPHPTVSAAKRTRLRESGVMIFEQPAAELIPLADLFVASVSSTINYALAAGLPVIDYDCYRYGYQHLSTLPAVRSATTLAGFRAALAFFMDEGERRRWEAAAREVAADWGLVDGKALERFVSAVLD